MNDERAREIAAPLKGLIRDGGYAGQCIYKIDGFFSGVCRASGERLF